MASCGYSPLRRPPRRLLLLLLLLLLQLLHVVLAVAAPMVSRLAAAAAAAKIHHSSTNPFIVEGSPSKPHSYNIEAMLRKQAAPHVTLGASEAQFLLRCSLQAASSRRGLAAGSLRKMKEVPDLGFELRKFSCVPRTCRTNCLYPKLYTLNETISM